jgi:AraC-like DNA-binding protein
MMATALSGAVVALTMVLALLLWRDARDGAALWLRWLLPVLAALELATGPMAQALPPLLVRALALLGTANLALIWLSANSLLIDGFALRRRHVLVAALLCSGPLLVWAGWAYGPLGHFASLLPFLMLGQLLWLAIIGRSDDLVPGRRRFRLLAPGLLLLAALVSLVSELVGDAGMADIIRAGLSGLPAALVLALWLLRVDVAALAFESAPAPAPPPPAIDPRDADLARRLEQALGHDRLWQREGLSIDQLAAHLGTPPHRLRVLINKGLGQRNFAGFINGYRIRAAQAALADPARGRDTILAIAYEAGFASLATFNRVFRDAVGDTPSDYRAKMLRDLEV